MFWIFDKEWFSKKLAKKARLEKQRINQRIHELSYELAGVEALVQYYEKSDIATKVFNENTHIKNIRRIAEIKFLLGELKG